MGEKKKAISKEATYILTFIIISLIYYLISKESLSIFVIFLPVVLMFYLSDKLKDKYFSGANKSKLMLFNIASYLLVALVVYILSRIFMPSFSFNLLRYLAIMIFTDFLIDKFN